MMLLPAGMGLIGGGSSGPATTLGTGLVSWWDLEEVSTLLHADAKGVNDLTATTGFGSPTGKVGLAANVSAGNELIKTSPSSVDFTTGDFTTAIWVNTSASNFGLICRWVVGSNQRMWALLLEGGIAKLAVSADGSSIAQTAATGSSLNNSAWHLIVGWRDTANNQLGIQVDNGTPATASLSGSTSLYTNTVSLVLGALDGAGTYAGGGALDSGGIWSRLLTSTERGDLWNGGSGRSFATL